MVTTKNLKPWADNAPHIYPTCRYIAIGGAKGGTGKSTICVNLALLLAASGKKVILVDGDPQGTSRYFSSLRKRNFDSGVLDLKADPHYMFTPWPTPSEDDGQKFKVLGGKADYVVFDLGGYMSGQAKAAAIIADLILVPTGADAFDLNGFDRYISGLKDVINPIRVANGALPISAFVFFNKQSPHVNSKQKRAGNAALDRMAAKHDVITSLDVHVYLQDAIKTANMNGMALFEISGEENRNVTAMNELRDFVLRGN